MIYPDQEILCSEEGDEQGGKEKKEEEVIVVAVVYLYLQLWENAHNIFLGGKASHRTEFSVLPVYKQVACAIYYVYIYA